MEIATSSNSTPASLRCKENLGKKNCDNYDHSGANKAHWQLWRKKEVFWSKNASWSKWHLNWGLSRLWKDVKRDRRRGNMCKTAEWKWARTWARHRGTWRWMRITACRRLSGEGAKERGITLIHATHIPSHFKNYLGWNHTGENTEIGLKNWDFNPDLIDSKTKASLYYCQLVVP